MKVLTEFLTQDNLIFMLQGAGLSLLLAAIAVCIGLILGTLGAAAKLSKYKVLRILGNVYVEVIRGTPMLLQILFFYLAVPMIVQSVTGERFNADPFICGLIALSINSGAYSTELIRSGIQGVDKGQWEACETIGMNYVQTMRYVILPQAFKRIVPPIVSEFITLIKDSSLISCIGVSELLLRTQVMGASYSNYLVPLVIAGFMYLMMTLTVSYFARRLERKLAASD
ncbi:amino acid ABC transporter permease [Candidatus Stoquefichus massiliensis]|uniref:amino acid ABC transporter permease n=1 Tax=Candidatus Stoquefichus massiliensis TaxID=1470350 RepID=UPI00047F05C9|nr:amino acid ABC transporter permease [Candidatus Stoquefichus massiliensis]